jgi:hypothetical protein
VKYDRIETVSDKLNVSSPFTICQKCPFQA